MMSIRKLLPLLAALPAMLWVLPSAAAAAPGAPPAGAADRPELTEPGHAPLQSNCASLSEAVERVRRQHGGRIISAETTRRGNREVHVIKVLTRDNKVRTVRVNGCRTGNRGG